MPLADLILTALTMLLGEEGKDYCLYGCDGEDWWILRLYSRIN